MTNLRKAALPGIVIVALLASWVFVSGRQRQIAQIVTSPRVALALWKTCPEGRGEGREYEQSFWRSHPVYHLACDYAPCGIDTPFAVAVTPIGEVIVLSGNEGPTVVDGAFYEYAAEPLHAFNSISRQEGVHIDETNVEEYLTFFADAYISWGDLFVPDPSTLETILSTDYDSADNFLWRSLSGKPPVFEIMPARDGAFQARAYTWWFWIGEVYRLDLSVRPEGAIAFSTTPHGTQPGTNNDVPLRTQH